MNAQVFKKRINGAATHAIVIGVGHYLDLPGGKSRKKFAGAGGMRQLKSPPQSAKAMAGWLIEEYKHPKKRLGSVSLLVSEPKQSQFTLVFPEPKTTVHG